MSAAHVNLPPRYGPEMALLGRGGFGVVYRTVDRLLGIPVAVKVPYRGSDKDLAREVTTELQAAAFLRHPGIVQVIDAGTDMDGYPFLAMEYAGAGSFQRFVERGPPPWEELLPLLLDLLDAMSHAHARGLVHRDIKDQNILLAEAEDGRLRPKLADFGLAKVAQRRGEYQSTRLAAGTLLYMAPETFDNDIAGVHPTADLYAFGVLLYLLVGRERPWDADDLALVLAKSTQVHHPLVLRAGYRAPDGLCAIVDRLLARSPGDRYELAADVKVDLLAVSAPDGGVPPPRPGRAHDREPGSFESSWISRFAAAVPPDPPPVPAVPSFPAGAAVALVREPEIVGREAERAWLWQRARAAMHRASATVLLGPPGIGRSRLCRWLAESLEVAGLARTMHVRLGGGPGPGEAAARAVRRFLGLGRLTGQWLVSRLLEWLGARKDDVAPDAQALANWLDPSGAPSLGPGEPDRPIARQAGLVEILLRLEAARGLVCLWVEEEAPTPGGFDLAMEVLRRCRAHDVPLLLLYEPQIGEGDQTLPSEMDPLVLGPMQQEQIHEILCDLAPGGVAPPELAASLRGSPARAVASARLLAEQQRSRLEEGARIPAAPSVPRPAGERSEEELALAFSATMTLPKLGLARLKAFVDQGGEREGRERAVLLLSLLPRPCRRETLDAAWSAAGGAAGALAHHLDCARQAGVVIVDEDESCDLSGAALCDAAEELRAGREDLPLLQRACAEALLASQDVSPEREHLAAARLFLLAGEAARAFSVACGAAEHLLVRDAAAAQAAWGQATEALDALGAEARDPLRVRAAVGRARAARAAGDLDAAETAVAGLSSDGLPAADRAALLEVLASVAVIRGNPEDAHSLAEQAFAAWVEAGDDAGRARARLLSASALLRKGRVAESIPVFESARDLARVAGSPLDVARALWRLAWSRRASGDLAAAQQGFDEALALARSLGARGVEAIVLRELGNLAILQKRHGDAEARLREASALLEAGGFHAETAVTRISLGELARARGDLNGARTEYSAALGLTRAYGATGETLVALLNLAITELAMGKLSSAERRLGEVDRLLLPSAPHRLRPYVEAVRLAVRAGRGEWDSAEEALEVLARQAEGLAPDADLRLLLEQAAEFARQGGREALAFDAWDIAVDLARRGGDAEALERLKKQIGGR